MRGKYGINIASYIYIANQQRVEWLVSYKDS